MSDFGECTAHLVGRVADVTVPIEGMSPNVINFRIAIEKQGKPQLFRVVAWGEVAKYMKRYVGIGDLLYIIGPLESRSWEQNGEKRHSMEITALKLQKLGHKRNTE